MSDSHSRWASGISCCQLEGLFTAVPLEDTMRVGTLVDEFAGEGSGAGMIEAGPRHVCRLPSKSDDSKSTKPKVTGSNPVGRAHRRGWIELDGERSCGAG